MLDTDPEAKIEISADKGDIAPKPASRLYSFCLTFPIMFALWIVFSGKFDSFHLSLGVISCALVAFFSGDMLFPHAKPLGKMFKPWPRFLVYIPWLMWQIWLANLHVLKITFHPRMLELIDPHLIRFKTTLKSDLAQVTFANSITLTPGTITVRASKHGDFVVHAIDRESSEPLPGEMEKRVAWTFGEK